MYGWSLNSRASDCTATASPAPTATRAWDEDRECDGEASEPTDGRCQETEDQLAYRPVQQRIAG